MSLHLITHKVTDLHGIIQARLWQVLEGGEAVAVKTALEAVE